MNKGARTLKVPVVVIPLVLQFTFSGGNITYDPTAGDTGCLGAGNTAVGLTQNSPVFQNYPFTFGGTNVGNTQYPDAFQRSEFWTGVSASGGAYHLLLTPTVAATQTLTFANSYANGSHAATYSFNGQCGSAPFAVGSTNPQGGLGLVDINTLDPPSAGNRLISGHHREPVCPCSFCITPRSRTVP